MAAPRRLAFAAFLVALLLAGAALAWRRRRRHFRGARLASPAARAAAASLRRRLEALSISAASLRAGCPLLPGGLERVRAALGAPLPSHADLVAVYRGLADSDSSLRASAEACRLAASGAPPDVRASLEAFSRALHSLPADISRLGAALRLE